MRLRRSCRRSRRRGCSQPCTPAGGAGTSRACSSRRILQPAGTCKRGPWRIGQRLRSRSSHRPSLPLPGLRPDRDRGGGSKRHASVPRSRCCSCARHSRRPAPIPWCTRWAVPRIRRGLRLRRSIALPCIDRIDPSRRTQPLLRGHSCRPDRPVHRAPPSSDTPPIGEATPHVSGPRKY